MDIGSFTAALRRSWVAAGLLLAAAIFGANLYVGHTIQSTAEATVAVRDPLTVRPDGYQAAQITFDAIVASRRLSQRVAASLGERPDAIEAAVSVEVVPAKSGINVLSPLYAVKAERRTDAEAVHLVTTVVKEATALYVELNQANSAEVERTLGNQQEEATTALAESRDAFDRFVTENRVENLPAQLSSVEAREASLRQQVDTARADLAGARAVGETTPIRVVRDRLAQFTKDLVATVTERDRLRKFSGDYSRLLTARDRAQARVNQLDDLEKTMILNQLLPLTSQIKVLDEARIQSSTLMKILVYAVATLLGLLAGASAVYARALRDRSKETAESISIEFDTPVLARIPPGSLRRALR